MAPPTADMADMAIATPNIKPASFRSLFRRPLLQSCVFKLSKIRHSCRLLIIRTGNDDPSTDSSAKLAGT